MKCKPPFLLYSNINSKKIRPKLSEKYGNKLKLIFSKIPEDVVKKNPELEKIVNPQPKIYYDVITSKKPQLIEITSNMRDSQEKVVTNLNSLREMLYDFNQEEEELLGNFSDIQEENNKFSKNYKKIQKDKNKFSTGTYLDYDYLIGIAGKYSTRGIKVPKIASEKSVFAGDPLILGGSELEDFIVYNLGDRKKSNIFLKKVENLIRRKETGNYAMNDVELKNLEIILKNEKPKGYVDPNILIPRLKNEIISYKNACENVVNLDKFLEKKKKNNITISKNNSDDNLIKNTNILLSPKYFHRRKMKKLDDLNIVNETNKNNKIIIKKNLSFVNKININNTKDNINNSNSNIHNKISSISTRAFLSPKHSSENSKRIISSKITNSNISSAMSRKKTISLKFSPLPSPIYRNNNIKKINLSILNDLYSGKRRNNNSYREENMNNILNKNYRIFSVNNERNNNNKMDRIFSVNNINRIKKKNLISLRSNSIDYFNLKKPSIKHDISSFESDKYDNIIKKENNISKEEKTEENELILLKNELEKKGEKGEMENIKKSLNINDNVIDNKYDKANNKTDDKNLNKENDKSKNENNKINLSLEEKSNKEEDNNIKTDKIYNYILDNKYHSKKIKIEINDYLKSKGYDISSQIKNKDVFLNIMKMRKKMGDRNFLLEEYNLRNGDFSKKFLPPKQRKIIEKNDGFLKKIEDSEFRFKKLLLEKNIDKADNDSND